jgi:glycosyltransferase involved in cell wall biosynthesis
VAAGDRRRRPDRLLLLGERTDVRDCLAAFDLFVLPSRTEGMSNALLEAMAMELPVVATAVGGNSEVITADTTGVLVPPDDPAALAAAIEVVATTPGLGERLGAAARRRVEERFGARAMVRRLETVYASVLPDARLATRVRSAAAA